MRVVSVLPAAGFAALVLTSVLFSVALALRWRASYA